MDEIQKRMNEALHEVRRRFDGEVRVGIILGTGLGGLAEHIDRQVVIDYRDIPNFPHSTALSHRGQLVIGSLGGVPVVAMQGRCHLYEGYSSADVGMPVLLMNALGAKGLIVSNASGGMNPKHASGDILVIEDHINLMWDNSLEPLAGMGRIRRNETTVVPYDRELIDIALSVARRENFAAHPGVYVSVSGPTYETRAEYRLFRRIGGDVVGMSTIPEVVVGASCGMRIMAMSMITNIARPDAPEKVDAEDVVQIAARSEPNLRKIVMEVLQEFAE